MDEALYGYQHIGQHLEIKRAIHLSKLRHIEVVVRISESQRIPIDLRSIRCGYVVENLQVADADLEQIFEADDGNRLEFSGDTHPAAWRCRTDFLNQGQVQGASRNRQPDRFRIVDSIDHSIGFRERRSNANEEIHVAQLD